MIQLKLRTTFFFLLFVGINTSHCQTKVKVEIFDNLNNSIAHFPDSILQSKLDSAIALLENTVNSVEFERKFQHERFLRRRGYQNGDIIKLIRTGTEENSQPDGIINLKVAVYSSQLHEIGHTDEENIIHTNMGYILENGPECYAAHLLHEYCHVLGFKHFPLPMIFRSQTVPYKVGTIVAQLLNSNCP